MLCYEPATDSWYGPIQLIEPPWLVVGATDGLWIGNARGLGFMETSEFKAAAVAANRVITSGDLKKRQEELYKALPPLESAKYFLAKKDLARVTALLEPILKDTPEEPEALLMMGFAREALAHRPQEALGWYEKLAAIKGDQAARLTGMVTMLSVKNQLQQYAEVVDLGGQIEKEFPAIDWGYGGKKYSFRQTIENAQWQLRHPKPATQSQPASQPAAAPVQ